MTISAKVICDSISSVNGVRLTTLALRYPKFIHGEFMTHRDFSRNASSSRAIPFKRMVEDIQQDMAMPVYWGKNQKGMQAAGELSVEDTAKAMALWQKGFDVLLPVATELYDLDLHKQTVNRMLEPWAHINVLVSATRWNNFFTLRDHKDAQPEIRRLAEKMKFAMYENIHIALDDSRPKILRPGQWHLPYVKCDLLDDRQYHLVQIGDNDYVQRDLGSAKSISVARCARVSYKTFETGSYSQPSDDVALNDKLMGAQPLHASPLEHLATPDELVFDSGIGQVWHRRDEWGNFHTWRQYRKMVPGEYVN